MITLLQWPRSFRSPSRNQTPGATMRTVSGTASERAAKKASPPSVANATMRKARKRDIEVSPWEILYSPYRSARPVSRCREDARDRLQSIVRHGPILGCDRYDEIEDPLASSGNRNAPGGPDRS